MEPPTVTEIAARRIKERRLELGWTGDQLCEAIDGALSRSAISQVENGKRRVALDEIPILARALGVPPLLLLLPLGEATQVQAIPGEPPMSLSDAFTWWIGATRPAPLLPSAPAERADADGGDRG